MEPVWIDKAKNELLINNERRSDVKFILGEEKKTIFGHQLIIENHSQVFYTMFSNNEFFDVQKGVIEIPDLTPAVFLEMLKYMYTGEISITDENLVDIYYCAEKYMVEGIKKICLKNISLDNVLTIFEANSEGHKIDDVQNKCTKVLKTNPIKVFQDDAKIQNMSAKNIEVILHQHYDRCCSHDLANLVATWKQKEGNKLTTKMERIACELNDGKKIERIFVSGEEKPVVHSADDTIGVKLAVTADVVNLIGIGFIWLPFMESITVLVDDEIITTKPLVRFEHIQGVYVEHFFGNLRVSRSQHVKIIVNFSKDCTEKINYKYFMNASFDKYFKIVPGDFFIVPYSYIRCIICEED